MARGNQKAAEADEPQDVSAYLGVDPIYQNYSDDRNKPFRTEVDPDLEGDEAEANKAAVEAEDVAYSHQEWTREDAGQDPVTGEPLDIDEAAALKAKREQYKDPNWGPNIPHAMTGKDTGTTVETGSTDQVNSDGTTGESTKTSNTPAAPPAPSAPGENK